MPNEQTYRQFDGAIKTLSAKNEYLTEVTVTLLNDTLTANNWVFTRVAEHKNEFVGKPLLIAYEFGGNRIGGGHNATKKRDENGKEYLSFTGATDQRIIGAMSDDPDDIWTETDDNGVTWVKGKGLIWNWYAREAADKIKRDSEDGRPMAVSIEALVSEFRDDEGIEYEIDYTILGTTILGDGVRPAVAGAHIAALSEIESDFKELKLRAASYIDPEENNIGTSEEPIKPQKKSTVKETKALKAFSKKQLAVLSAKFEGYSVLAAGQDDNGIHVCLMSDDGCTAVYTMGSLEDEVALDKITRINAQVSFEFGEDAVAVDCCDITDRFAAAIIEANTRLEATTKNLEEANQTITTMRETERKRRVQAATNKALSTLEAFNANREEKIEKEILNSINEAIANGDYTECVDADGCWTGEEKVMNDVLAKCAAKQMELDKASAMRKNSVNVWEGFGASAGVSTGLSALLSKYSE